MTIKWKVVPKTFRERVPKNYDEEFWAALLTGETIEVEDWKRSTVYYKLAKQGGFSLKSISRPDNRSAVWLEPFDTAEAPEIVPLNLVKEGEKV